jgi:rSAM/selenodomain-associated transferase 2
MEIDISIIIPVLNEGKSINTAIKSIRQQKFAGNPEIIVVDGNRYGSTICRLKDKSVLSCITAPGRGVQMNAGAKMASGKILLFLHCDTRLPENGLNAVKKHMKKFSVKAGAFDLSIDGTGFSYRILEKAASFRSRITRIPYGDQAIFIRKDYFFHIGQYKNIPIMEDVELMVRIKKYKGKLKILNLNTSTSPRRWEKEGKIYCTLRNWTILTLFFMGTSPEKLAAIYKADDGHASKIN